MTDYSTFLNQVEDLLITEALQPWQVQAQEAWLPWVANEELKSRWIEMIVSGKNDLVRAAGFLALARVSNLGPGEEHIIHTVIPTQLTAKSVTFHDPRLPRITRRTIRLFRQAYDGLERPSYSSWVR